MNEIPDYRFDRRLEPEEFEFWNKLFANFPCHHNRSFQDVIEIFSCESSFNEIYEQHRLITECRTNEEMFALFDQFSLPRNAKHVYMEVITDLHQIFPTAKPVNLFLFAIYGGIIQDWNLTLNYSGINLEIPRHGDIGKMTYVPQLAMVADLMAGRLQELIPNLDISPINLSGEKKIKDRFGEEYIFRIVSSNIPCYCSSKNNGHIVTCSELDSLGEEKFQFSLTFSNNGNKKGRKYDYAPLDLKQADFLNLIRKNYLENSLSTQNSNQPKKIKI